MDQVISSERPRVLLNADQLAAELSVSPLVARRAVALGLIESRPVGDGQWRVTPAALTAYVDQGAQLLMPRWDLLTDWPDKKSDDFRADRLQDRLQAELANQLPTPGEVQGFSDFDKDQSIMSYDRPGSITAAMKKIAAGEDSLPQVPGESPEPMIAAWGRSNLRWAAREQIASVARTGESALETLFRDPQTFRAIFDRAYNEIAERRLIAVGDFTVTNPPKSAFPERSVRVSVLAKQRPLLEMVTPQQWQFAAF